MRLTKLWTKELRCDITSIPRIEIMRMVLKEIFESIENTEIQEELEEPSFEYSIIVKIYQK